MWWWIAGGVVAAVVAAIAGSSEESSSSSSQSSSRSSTTYSSSSNASSSSPSSRDAARSDFCRRRLRRTKEFFKSRGLPESASQGHRMQADWCGYKDWVLGSIERHYEVERTPPREILSELESLRAAQSDIDEHLQDL